MLSSFSYSARALDNPAYPQYTEAACILIADQMARFKQQPQSPAYQSVARNYSRHCQNPIPYVAKSVEFTPKVSQQVAPVKVAALQPEPVVSNRTDVMSDTASRLFELLKWPVLLIAVFLALRAFVRGFDGLSHSERLGRRAEQQLARHLVEALSEGYRHYHNIILKTEQGDLTEIDHLITSPYGIFVIEVKNYKGWIFGAEHQAHWVQQHFKRKHQFQNPLRQNYKHTADQYSSMLKAARLWPSAPLFSKAGTWLASIHLCFTA